MMAAQILLTQLKPCSKQEDSDYRKILKPGNHSFHDG